MVLSDPGAHSSPFFHMVPSWLLWPLIVLATAATVIASQALISGAYSLTMQAVQMGYVPFINIRHTSHEEHGQIYIPQVNTLLAVGCIASVIGFRSSNALASAYGIAVTLAMIATTLLLPFAARRLWKWSAAQIAALCIPLLALEATFFAANSIKVMQGGWLPLAIAGSLFLLMTTWKEGRNLLRKNTPQLLSLMDFVMSATALGRESGLPARVPGTAVFLSARAQGAPMSSTLQFEAQSSASRAQHRAHHCDGSCSLRSECLSRQTKDLSQGFFRIIAHFGFMETPSIREILDCCERQNLVIEEQKTSFFLGLETIVCKGKAGMSRWREHLFAGMSRHAQKPAEFFKLP